MFKSVWFQVGRSLFGPGRGYRMLVPANGISCAEYQYQQNARLTERAIIEERTLDDE